MFTDRTDIVTARVAFRPKRHNIKYSQAGATEPIVSRLNDIWVNSAFW
jgi:hypothetical protein